MSAPRNDDCAMRKMLMAVLAAAAVTAACHQAPPPQAISMSSAVGSYTFAQSVVGQDGPVDISGTVLILPDTIRVETRGGPCIPPRHPDLDARSFAVGCPAGFGIVFDRSDPIGRAQYSVTTTVQRTVTTCIRYVTDQQGHRTCAETGFQTETQHVPHTGGLHLSPKQPIAPAGRP